MDHITHLPLSQLTQSPTNPRRACSTASLDELVQSIASQGLLQPITVRPIVQEDISHQQGEQADARPSYEIVFGQRRYHAVHRLGMETIPCIVRAMTDQQASEAQIHENLERDGIHPIEEGDAYQALINQHGMSIGDLLRTTGKARTHIYSRLKLANGLSEPMRRLCLAGTLDTETALLVARIPSPSLQMQAADAVQGKSYREAKLIITSRYQTDLRNAKWQLLDATLVESAGDCYSCPHRSINDKSLDSSTDVCTSPDCYTAKRHAHGRRVLDGLAAEGWTVTDILPPPSSRVPLADSLLSTVELLSSAHPHVMKMRRAAQENTGDAIKFTLAFEATEILRLSLARTCPEASNPSPKGEGDAEVEETTMATPRDKSHEEPGPLTRGEGDMTEGGHGLTAMGRSAEVDALVLKALRYRGKPEVVDLRWICAALVDQVSPATLRAIGVPEPGCGRSYEERICATLAERSPDELARIALACAIDTIARWSPSGLDLPLIEMRLNQSVEPADAGTSQSVNVGLTADDSQMVDESAPRTRPLKRSIKYRHPTTGETWSGKGLQPAWFRREMDAGRSISEFEVKQ
jgi:ParB/RepB/Spo0J family partition protein